MKTGFEMLVIGFGGACGALMRYYIGTTATAWQATNFPWGTFIANISGCFLIGLMMGSGKHHQHEGLRLGFGIGFLGSLTTFSTFSAETISQLTSGNWKLAAINTIANLICCLLATAAGITLGRKLFA